ncbi:MAG: hypothetical protein AAGC46_18045 [Solirubrobacteraceae bacterium]|nr:hypothetical protein [Patulibacter sp.]
MHRPHTVPRRFLPPAGAAAILLAATLAGCGGSDGSAGTPTPVAAAPTTFTDTTPAPTSTTPSPSPTRTPKASPSSSSSSSRVPEHAKPVPPTSTEKEDSLTPATPADKLIVSSPSGQDPKWRVAARMQGDGTVCITVTSLGVSTPTPDCESGAQLGAQLLTSMGSGEGTADVGEVQRTVRQPASDILVSGAVTGGVTGVDIDYRHEKIHAKLSEHTVSLPVKASEIKAIAGADAKKVPNPLEVKVFGVSFPKVSGNPPTSAVLKTKHPVRGVLTFTLQ